MSATPVQDFEILPSPHYAAHGNLYVMCPYGQGIIQSWSADTGMVRIKLSHGGTISILNSKVVLHRQHQDFAAHLANQAGAQQQTPALQQQQQPVVVRPNKRARDADSFEEPVRRFRPNPAPSSNFSPF